MATRFYYQFGAQQATADSGIITPTFDAGWEITQKFYGALIPALVGSGKSVSLSVTVPITTTQDILIAQFISPPLQEQTITGTVSTVLGFCGENASTNNATLAVSVRLVSPNGTSVRGTMFTAFGTDTEFGAVTPSSRIVNAQALTSQTAQSGDRIVVEVGVNAAAPTAAGSAPIQFMNNFNSDYALTSALTTLQNTWIEFSQNLLLFPNSLPTQTNNYQFVKAPDGISVTEKIR